MQRLRKSYFGIILLILFGGYFYSINLCFHTHEINGHRITHSHPYSQSHNHSDSGLQTIQVLTTFSSDDVTSLDCVLESFVSLSCEIATPLHFSDIENSFPGALYLRDPPYSL